MNETPKPRILAIDDNPSIHEDFRKILINDDDSQELDDVAASFFGEEESSKPGRGSSIDAELDSALQGQDGLKMVQTAIAEGRPYSMAFCDMRMPPGWDGLTTIENLWKADPDLQVVICSAYSDNTWSDISERLGHSDKLLILKKPFDNSEVLQMAAALIEKRRLLNAANVKQEELEQLVEERTVELEAAREDAERLINSIDSALIQTDKNNIVCRWNQPAASLFNIRAAEAIGKPFKDLPIAWGEENELLDVITQIGLVSSRRATVNLDVGENGQRDLNFSVFPIRTLNEYQGKLVFVNDVTKQRQLELQLLHAQNLMT